jgi:hypothetical protein
MEDTAKQITLAFRHASARDYLALYPSLTDFYRLMESSKVYGDLLDDAKQEFADTYTHTLLPSVQESFEAVLQEGKEKGIDWSTVEFVRLSAPELEDSRFTTVPVTIIITSKGLEYQLTIEKAIIVNGQLKVSQYLTLK